MTQGWAGSYAFYKNGKLNLQGGMPYILPSIIGAVIGVIVAVNVSNEQFKTAFSYLMIAMLFIILVKPKRWLRETDTTCLLYTSPSPRDRTRSRMPSSA